MNENLSLQTQDLLDKTLEQLSKIKDKTSEEYYKLLDQAERLTEIIKSLNDTDMRGKELEFKKTELTQKSADNHENNAAAVNRELISTGGKVLCAGAGIALGVLELTGKTEGIAVSTSSFFKRAERLVDK